MFRSKSNLNLNSWLWALSPHHGLITEEDIGFIEAVRVRLGAGGPPDVALCGCCGKAQLDKAGRHASRCALGDATAGHNALLDSLIEFASAAASFHPGVLLCLTANGEIERS